MPWFPYLTEHERRLAQEAVVALMDGPWISKREFATRVGVDRARMDEVARTWPPHHPTSLDEHGIRQAVLEVAYGMRVSAADWPRWFSRPRREFEILLHRIDGMAHE